MAIRHPLTVRQAARFLGVSAQTVYLWVERRQIPHLRVMGRNIRLLQSDLEPFRAQFKQEVENVVYRRNDSNVWWMRYRDDPPPPGINQHNRLG